MKLWLLRPHPSLKDKPKTENPWEPWYDKAFGFVIRAETEAEARIMADAESGNEGCSTHGPPPQYELIFTLHPWLVPDLSTCIELTPEGSAGVVIRDFQAA